MRESLDSDSAGAPQPQWRLTLSNLELGSEKRRNYPAFESPSSPETQPNHHRTAVLFIAILTTSMSDQQTNVSGPQSVPSSGVSEQTEQGTVERLPTDLSDLELIRLMRGSIARRDLARITKSILEVVRDDPNYLPTHFFNFCPIYINGDNWRILISTVDVIKDAVGENHPSTLTCMAKLSAMLADKGRYEEAETLARQVLNTRKRELHEEHPDLLTAMSGLAMILGEQDRYEEAVTLLSQTMNMRRNALGMHHPETLGSTANLAAMYVNQGKWKQAEQVLSPILFIMKRELGVEHKFTLTAMANLALAFSGQGRYGESEQLQLQVVDTRKRVFGEEDPRTLTCINSLASTYCFQGRYLEAGQLYLEVVTAQEKVLGGEHRSTLSSKASLAYTYDCQGRYRDAQEVGELAVELMTRVLGRDNPMTLNSLGILATIYHHQQRHDEAQRLQVQAMEGLIQKLGADHPDTLTSMASLACSYQEAGKLEDAKRLASEVLQRGTQSNPTTLDMMANIVISLAEMKLFDEAESFGVRVFGASRALLGENHPDTLINMSNLAMIYNGQGRREEAGDLMTEAIQRQMNSPQLGGKHPSLIINIYNLGLIRVEQGQQDLARYLWVRNLPDMETGLGREHVLTVRCKRYLDVMEGKNTTKT